MNTTRALSLAVLCGGLWPGAAAAGNFVGSNDSGDIFWEIGSSSTSAVSAKAVRVIASIESAIPGLAELISIATATSDMSVAEIPIGSTKTFDIKYVTGPGLPDGSFEVKLGLIANNPADPPLSQVSASVKFKVDTTPPEITIYDIDGEIVGSSGTTSSLDLEIYVDDYASDESSDLYGSGPGHIEVWYGDVDVGTKAATDGTNYNDFHSYSAESGLGVLDNLPAGKITIRALDQTGSTATRSFFVTAPPPRIFFRDSLDRFTYEDSVGIDSATIVGSTGTPSSTSNVYEFHIRTATNTAFYPFTLTRDGVDVSTLLPTGALSPPPTSSFIDGYLTLNPGEDGLYVLTTSNTANGISKIAWRYATLLLSISKTETYSEYVGGGTFVGHVGIEVESSRGGVVVVPGPSVPMTTVFSGSSPGPEVERTVAAYDIDGNSAEETISAQNVALPIGDGPFTIDSTTFQNYDSDPTSTEMPPGAIIFVGTYTSPVTLTSVFSRGAFIEPVVASTASGPLVGTQPIGTYVFKIVTNGTECDLAADTVDYSSATGVVHTMEFANEDECTLSSTTYLLRVHGKLFEQTSFASCNTVSTDGVTCLDGNIYELTGSVSGNIYGQSLVGPDPPFNEYLPGQSTATLPYGIYLSDLNLSTAAVLTVALAYQPPILGYKDIRSNAGYALRAAPVEGSVQAPLLNSPVTVRLDYGPTGLTSPEEESIKIYYSGDGGSSIVIEPDDVDVSSHVVLFDLPQFGKFKLIRPTFSSSSVRVNGAFSIVTADTVTIGNPASDPRYPQFRNVLASRGIVLVSTRAWSLGPANVFFSTRAVVEVRSTITEVFASGLSTSALFLGQYSLNTAYALPMFSVHSDTLALVYTALINRISSSPVFAIYGTTTATTALDLLPPLTVLAVEGSTIAPGATTNAISTTPITFTAGDQTYPGAPSTGVAGTYYLIDDAFFSTTATPGTLYTSAFTLESGNRILSYYSRDNYGNVEPVKVSTVIVAEAQSRSVGGLGIALDEAGEIWSVALDGESVALSHRDEDGLLISSVVLPGAISSFPWSVIFDTNGAAYAIGSSVGDNDAALVTVYKASAASGALISSQTYDSGFENNNYVLAASSRGWIVGAIQTEGPISQEEEGSRSYSAAIWSFNPSSGLVDLSTSYTRAGFDIITGLAMDATGNLWVSGFSQSPAPISPRQTDLIVRGFAPDGQTPLGDPVIREGYLNDYQPTLLALPAIYEGTLYVTAPRERTSGGTNLNVLAFDLATGDVLDGRTWRFMDGASAYPGAITTDFQGEAVIAGGLSNGGTLTTVWRYDPSGPFLYGTLADGGGARGASFRGSDFWMSVDGSTTPFLYSQLISAVGEYFDDKSPRTTVIASSPSVAGPVFAGIGSEFGFSVPDDKVDAGDGLGVGTAQTYYAVDGGGFAEFTSTFTLSEGTHTIAAYSLDLEGNAEVVVSTIVGVDFTTPTITLVSSGAAFSLLAQDPLVNGAASGVGTINYLIDVSPETCEAEYNPSAPHGTCENLGYVGPFALAAGTHTVYFQALDRVGNGFDTIASSEVVVEPDIFSLSATSGPIGAAFTIFSSGGFGVYSETHTVVLVGVATAPVSDWNDTTIVASIPGELSTGTYTVMAQRHYASSSAAVEIGSFLVLLPTVSTMNPTFGLSGTGVMLTGSGFGPYDESAASVLLGGATVPLSFWNDTTIIWTVPNDIDNGTYPVVVRRSPAGGSVETSSLTFNVGSSHGPFGFGFFAAPPLAARPDWHFQGYLRLSTARGGTLQSPSLAAVQVPPGALPNDVEVTMRRTRTIGIADQADALEQARLAPYGEAISFGPEGTLFARPVTLTLPYDPNLISFADAAKLVVGYYDPVAKTWTPLPSHVDTARHVVTAETDHFSLYQPLGPFAPSAAIDEWGLRAGYAFPNPARGNATLTLRIQPGLADSVEARVYDISGRRIYSSSDFRFSVTDDGNGLGPQNTYDHIWGLSGIGSGVYTYVITARKSGESDIRKTGKVGVIK